MRTNKRRREELEIVHEILLRSGGVNNSEGAVEKKAPGRPKKPDIERKGQTKIEQFFK